MKEIYLDPIIKDLIPKWRREVIKKDNDKFFVVDGREGSGKSVLAQQLASNIDPDFNIDKIAFNAEEFNKLVKDPKRKPGDCIVLDEAFMAINSRSALTSVNKAMIGLATEMRQLNLFVIIVLPSFFDLDRYFTLWRCDTLFHVYLRKGDRGSYIVFGTKKKQKLYLLGKKLYNYSAVKSDYPPLRFNKGYSVDEDEYREKKAKAFREEKKKDSLIVERWKDRLGKLLKYTKEKTKDTDEVLAKVLGIPRSKVTELRNLASREP